MPLHEFYQYAVPRAEYQRALYMEPARLTAWINVQINTSKEDKASIPDLYDFMPLVCDPGYEERITKKLSKSTSKPKEKESDFVARMKAEFEARKKASEITLLIDTSTPKE